MCIFLNFCSQPARRLKLRNMSEFSCMSGGKALEMFATRGNIDSFQYKQPMTHYIDCSFSFSGMGYKLLKNILLEEEKIGEFIGFENFQGI